MDSLIWAKMHGATTHFPIALVLCSGACDAAGWLRGERAPARELHAVGYWTMLLGALGTVPAVISGIVMTKGEVLGHGTLRWHHLFAWPAFAFIVAAATWRVVSGPGVSRRKMAGYLIAMVTTTTLVCLAGYWGGELLLLS